MVIFQGTKLGVVLTFCLQKHGSSERNRYNSSTTSLLDSPLHLWSDSWWCNLRCAVPKRTVRQLALQNLIEVKLPDHRTAASVTDRQSGEMNFVKRRKEKSLPLTLAIRKGRLCDIRMNAILSSCMGNMQKPAWWSSLSLRRRCGIRKRVRDIWRPRIVVQFSKRTVRFLALLATNNVRISPAGIASLASSLRPAKKSKKKTSLSEKWKNNPRLAQKGCVRGWGLMSRGCDNVIHALVSMFLTPPQPARLDQNQLNS